MIDVQGYGITDISGLTITADAGGTLIDFDGMTTVIDQVYVHGVFGLDAGDFVFA